MAADLIRVRLHFDYAPPAALGCRMCWLLVDRSSCRVVADLESIIRDKFELSRGSILSLYIEDCYLPHTESVLLVRDNDCVRVKVETVSTSTTQTSPGVTSEKNRKRQRPVEEDASEEHGLTLEFKKTKRKKSVIESPAVNGLQAATEETQVSTNKKTKKKTVKEKPKSPPAALKPSPTVKKPSKSTEKVVKCTKKAQNSSSSSRSSSEDEPPMKKTPAPKLATKPVPAPASAKTLTNGRPALKKLPPPSSSSSSDTDSSTEEEDEAKRAIAKSANDKSKSEEAQTAPNTAENGDEDEIELVIKKPLQHPQGRIVVEPPVKRQAGQGRGKGKQEAKEPWSKGRGRGRGHCVQYSYNEEQQRDKEEPSYSTDTLTNVSVVLQNGVESTPKPDYTAMPLLAAPPQVGQKIAFKLLELTENYTPEVSEYKEAKILSFDPTSKQIELELLTSSQAPFEPGKFDLVYQNPDGSERVEYAVDRCTLISERWDSLLEPRLVI